MLAKAVSAQSSLAFLPVDVAQVLSASSSPPSPSPSPSPPPLSITSPTPSPSPSPVPVPVPLSLLPPFFFSLLYPPAPLHPLHFYFAVFANRCILLA
eukprot:3207476-Rhodomonas_salina.1